MLSKLKLFGMVAIFAVFLISSIASVVGTWRVNTALDNLAEEKKKVVVEGSENIVMDDLTRKVRDNEEITKTSMERLDELEKALNDLPEAVTVVNTKVIHQIVEKDRNNEAPTSANPRSIDTALRAIDELWRDYCERFPQDGGCLKRPDYAGEVRAQGTPDVPVPVRTGDE